MSSHLKISVLDLVGMRAGEQAGAAIARTVQTAQHVERLGYTRYWLAEHPSIAGLACSATSVFTVAYQDGSETLEPLKRV